MEWVWGMLQPGFVRWAHLLHKTTLTFAHRGLEWNPDSVAGDSRRWLHSCVTSGISNTNTTANNNRIFTAPTPNGRISVVFCAWHLTLHDIVALSTAVTTCADNSSRFAQRFELHAGQFYFCLFPISTPRRQHSAQQRNPNCWNYRVYVISADTVNTFKNRLDKFWSDQRAEFMDGDNTQAAPRHCQRAA